MKCWDTVMTWAMQPLFVRVKWLASAIREWRSIRSDDRTRMPRGRLVAIDASFEL